MVKLARVLLGLEIRAVGDRRDVVAHADGLGRDLVGQPGKRRQLADAASSVLRASVSRMTSAISSGSNESQVSWLP